MRVVAIPNPHFPPGEEALAAADVVLRSLDELTASSVAGGASGTGRQVISDGRAGEARTS